MTKPSKNRGGQRRRPKRLARWIPTGRDILVGMRLAGRPRARMPKRRDRKPGDIAAKADRPALQAEAPAPVHMGKALAAIPHPSGSGAAAETIASQGGFGCI